MFPLKLPWSNLVRKFHQRSFRAIENFPAWDNMCFQKPGYPRSYHQISGLLAIYWTCGSETATVKQQIAKITITELSSDSLRQSSLSLS